MKTAGQQMTFYPLEQVVAETIDFIRENLSNKGKIFVGFSGGKDSIVTADLMRRSRLPYQLYYSATGIDPPEVVRFIKREYPECEFLKPKITFWRGIIKKNPPAVFSRWCCDELKKHPSAAGMLIKYKVFGVRAEESSKRAKYQRIDYDKKAKKITHCYPVLYWNEGDIWEYIDDNNLAYPELYDWGFSRIGCIICPFHSNKSGAGHNFYKKHWPHHFKLFEKKCQQWFEKRKSQGRDMYFDTAEEFVENWYKGNVRWYKH